MAHRDTADVVYWIHLAALLFKVVFVICVWNRMNAAGVCLDVCVCVCVCVCVKKEAFKDFCLHFSHCLELS